MKTTCEGLTVNDTHSCAYSNGECDFTFKSCSSYKGTDTTICSSIILSSIYKKCQLVNEICKEVDKTCEEYNSSLSMTCSYLNPGNKKRCIYNDDNCETHYDNCADFTTGVDKTKCEANIPSNSQHKCIWKNDACTEVKKECNDYSSTYYYYSCSAVMLWLYGWCRHLFLPAASGRSLHLQMSLTRNICRQKGRNWRTRGNLRGLESN